MNEDAYQAEADAYAKFGGDFSKVSPEAKLRLSKVAGFTPPATVVPLNPAETTLRTEYDTKSKDFLTTKSAYDAIVSSNNDRFGKLTTIYNYIKMNDPNAVREGEIALAQNTAGIPKALVTLFQRAQNGILSDSEFAGIKKQAYTMYKTKQADQLMISNQYSKLAQQYGVDPNGFINARGEINPVKDPTEGMIIPEENKKGWDPLGAAMGVVTSYFDLLKQGGKQLMANEQSKTSDQEYALQMKSLEIAKQAAAETDPLKKQMLLKQSRISIDQANMMSDFGSKALVKNAEEMVKGRVESGLEGSFDQGFVDGMTTIANGGMKSLAMAGLVGQAGYLASAGVTGAVAGTFLKSLGVAGAKMAIANTAVNSAIYGTGAAISASKKGENATSAFVDGSIMPKIGIIEAISDDKTIAPYADTALSMLLPFLGNKAYDSMRKGALVQDNPAITETANLKARQEAARMIPSKPKDLAKGEEISGDFISKTKSKTMTGLAEEAHSMVKDRGTKIEASVKNIDTKMAEEGTMINRRAVIDHINNELDSSNIKNPVELEAIKIKLEQLIPENPSLSDLNKARLKMNEYGTPPSSGKIDPNTPVGARVLYSQRTGGAMRDIMGSFDETLGGHIHDQHIAQTVYPTLSKIATTGEFGGKKFVPGMGISPQSMAIRAFINTIANSLGFGMDATTLARIRQNVIVANPTPKLSFEGFISPEGTINTRSPIAPGIETTPSTAGITTKGSKIAGTAWDTALGKEIRPNTTLIPQEQSGKINLRESSSLPVKPRPLTKEPKSMERRVEKPADKPQPLGEKVSSVEKEAKFKEYTHAKSVAFKKAINEDWTESATNAEMRKIEKKYEKYL